MVHCKENKNLLIRVTLYFNYIKFTIYTITFQQLGYQSVFYIKFYQ